MHENQVNNIFIVYKPFNSLSFGLEFVTVVVQLQHTTSEKITMELCIENDNTRQL